MKIDPRKPPSAEQGRALKVIADAIAAERGNERETLQLIATFAICMMHGTFGKEHCRGFLQEAMNELDRPDALKIQLEVRHATRTQ